MPIARSSQALIVGAGPAGIAAGLALGKDALLLEKTTTMGGLSATIEFGGAVFDLGGHSFHTPHPEVRKLVFESLEMFEQERDARCYHNKEWIPYPFQEHFRQLSGADIVNECAEGLGETKDLHEPANFYEYIMGRFGSGIARHFMLPYNRKLWGDDLHCLDAKWVNQRIVDPTGTHQRFKETGGRRTPLQSNTLVAYPAQGGYGEIFRALGNRVVTKQFGTEVVHIDVRRRIAWDREGRKYPYQVLISTLPLTRLSRMLTEVPEELISAIVRLESVALELMLIAVDEPVRTKIQRVYCAQPDIPAHKIAINHNSSDWLRAKPAHGIIAEVSLAQTHRHSGRDLERILVDTLIEMGIVKDLGLIKEVRTIRIDNAYPKPTHGRQATVDLFQNWLAQFGIYSIGRFGEWAYINADEALFRGLELGKRISAEMI